MEEYQIEKTTFFEKWFNKQNVELKTRIDIRLDRIAKGNLGDFEWFGDIGEFRFHFGKGYRIYYTMRGKEVILLLVGGDKKSQDDDIKKARKILKNLK